MTKIDCVSGFFKTLDSKIEKLTIELDVFKNDETSQVNLNRQGCINLNTLIDTTTAIVKRNESAIEAMRAADKEGQNWSTIIRTNTPSTPPVSVTSSISLATLEERIDHLEDHSRRDNLLFYGFPEEKDENCDEKLKTMISKYNMIDTNNYDINFVRVHRLGRFSKQHTRPIIAKFYDYSVKTAILSAAKGKKLEHTDYAVSEDFSANTTKLRKALQSNIKGIKKKLDDGAELVFMRYKSLVVKDTTGKYRTFPASYILEKISTDPEGTWYDGLLKDTVIVRGVNTREKLG